VPSPLAPDHAAHAKHLKRTGIKGLAGKVTIVTGGATLIGAAVVERLRAAGHCRSSATRGSMRGRATVRKSRHRLAVPHPEQPGAKLIDWATGSTALRRRSTSD
jgi:NAD(P)-dependent dehydrogenase (short-subunit alcohol dehydrogenase family)